MAIRESSKVRLRVIDGLHAYAHKLAMTKQEERRLMTDECVIGSDEGVCCMSPMTILPFVITRSQLPIHVITRGAALNSRHREGAVATVAIQKSGKVTLRVTDGLPHLC